MQHNLSPVLLSLVLASTLAACSPKTETGTEQKSSETAPTVQQTSNSVGDTVESTKVSDGEFKTANGSVKYEYYTSGNGGHSFKLASPVAADDPSLREMVQLAAETGLKISKNDFDSSTWNEIIHGWGSINGEKANLQYIYVPKPDKTIGEIYVFETANLPSI